MTIDWNKITNSGTPVTFIADVYKTRRSLADTAAYFKVDRKTLTRFINTHGIPIQNRREAAIRDTEVKRRIKAYLTRHPEKSIAQVAKTLGVSYALVKYHKQQMEG